MAVPKKNKTTGEYQLQHQVSLDGYYNGKKIIQDKKDKKSNIEESGEVSA